MTLLRAQAPGIPAPHPSVHSQPYWDGCRRGAPALPAVCDRAARPRLRPSTVCGLVSWHTHGVGAERGIGSFYSWTVVWRPPDPSFSVPYAPAIVRLDEEFWLMSAIIGCQPDDLYDGMRVGVTFHPVSDAVTLPYFSPPRPGLKRWKDCR